MNTIFIVLLLALTTLLAASYIFLLKLGAQTLSFNRKSLGKSVMRALQNKYLWGSGILYFVTLILYVMILKILPLSIAYPVMSVNYVWAALLSKRYLHERIDAVRWIGIGLIVVGTALVLL